MVLINDLLSLLKSKKLNFKTLETSANAFIIEFSVLAKPASKVEKVKIGEDGVLIIQTRSRPVEGEANQAIIEIISELMGIPKSHVEILRGDKSKNKRIKLMMEITAKKNKTFYEQRINEL